jgi:hypothetical protein
MRRASDMATGKGIEVWVGGTSGELWSLWPKSKRGRYDPGYGGYWSTYIHDRHSREHVVSVCRRALLRAGCPHIPAGEKRLVRLVIEEVE